MLLKIFPQLKARGKMYTLKFENHVNVWFWRITMRPRDSRTTSNRQDGYARFHLKQRRGCTTNILQVYTGQP